MKTAGKKITLTLLACFLGTFLFAQEQKQINQGAIEKTIKAKTDYLKNQLNLSEGQEKELRDLTVRYEYKTAGGGTPQVELDAFYSTEIAKILNTEQMEKYNNLKSSDLNSKKMKTSQDQKAKVTSGK